MTRTFLRHPSLTVAVCMLLLIAQLQVNAENNLDRIKKRVQITIGQPSIWSLAQAHYFLAQMHERNNDLKSKFPTEDELNPNKINSNHIESLRSFFGIEANFDQGMGVENRLNLQKYKSDLARKEAAQTRLDEKVQERDQVEARIKTIKKRTTDLAAEQDTLGKIAEADRTDAQNQRLAQIKERIPQLKTQQTENENEKASLDEEVGTLTTQANATVSVPELKTPEVEKTADKTGKLPESDLYKEFVKDAFTNPNKPNISAQITLDNFIQMQYEIISKQLTLLRDEVGPDYRVVFLELPASIYTVDEKADDYVAQVEWTIEAYYRAKSESELKALRSASFYPNLKEAERNEDVERSYPVKLRSILQADCNDCWVPNSTITDRDGNSISLEKLGVRTLDIIPRQSALNINQNHAVVKSTAILGSFKALIGFAGKVDYQRQRELYDQYIQQAVFASGYGKGSATFGWTYGAVPGSKRMAPGVRTTYAILAVPREALALRLSARARAYKKDESPDGRHIITDPTLKFNMLIPTEDTQTFWVEGASYAPVSKGEWCTVILKGRNFSPQLGVLVNGAPLDRVISIATNKGKESRDHNSGTETKGEYEVVNSGSLILNFTMKPGYVGTPIITLITPEKTGDINSFKLDLNHEREKRSLNEAALTMPMFIEDFKFDRIGTPFTDPFTNRQIIRLSGKGFRPNADIFVDGVRVSSQHVSTSEYRIVRPTQDRFEVTINQPTKQSYETASLSVDPETAQQPVIVSYSQLQGSRARVRLALAFPGQTSITASVGQFEGKIVDPFTHRAVDSCALTADADKKFRFEVEVDAEQVPSKLGRSHPVLRDMISLNLTSPGGQNKSFDILLPLTPSISKIEAASGHYAFEQDVVIRGTNLQNVAKVFFGTRQAELLFQAERNSITVRVPRGAEVPDGGKVRVPVRLETKVDVSGRKVSNAGDLSSLRAYYAYTGGPSTKLNGKQEEPSGKTHPTGQGSLSKSEP